jgi:hypothetical protein
MGGIWLFAIYLYWINRGWPVWAFEAVFVNVPLYLALVIGLYVPNVFVRAFYRVMKKT